MRILIVKLSAIGDVIHTLPALTTLRRHHPGAEIDWVVEEGAADLLTGHPALTQSVIVPRGRWRTLNRERRWVSALRTFLAFGRELRARPTYDWVIDFQGLAKSAIWVAFSRGRRKAGYGPGLPRHEGAWLALNQRVRPGSPDQHAIDRNLALLEGLGFPRLPLAYDLPIPPAAEAEASALLAGVGVNPARSFVAINAMTRWATKNWELSRFTEVAAALHQRGVPVVFTGGPGDHAAISEICQGLPPDVGRLDGRTRLRVLAAVYQRARVLLTTDTGPMHLAAAVGTPVVALFGPTAPWRTGPYGADHDVLRTGIACSPCFKRDCPTRQFAKRACMLGLEAGQVVERVLAKWNRPTRPLTAS